MVALGFSVPAAEAAKPSEPAKIYINQGPGPFAPAQVINFTVDYGSYANVKYHNIVVLCYDYGFAPTAPDPQVGDSSKLVWGVNYGPDDDYLIYGGSSPWYVNGANTDSSCRAALYQYKYKGSGWQVIRLSEWVYFVVDSPLDSRYP